MTASIRVDAPGRLHLGFLDPSATLGRRFGSVGVTIDGLSTSVEMAFAQADAFVAGEDAGSGDLERLRRHVAALRRSTSIDRPLRVTLRSALPPHAGFGSGTQLALAAGRAFSALHELALSTDALAQTLARGARSGIGIAAFTRGGFLVDGGHAAAGTLPPLLSRMTFPQAWRIVLALDDRFDGLHGGKERESIAALPPFSQARAADLCHQLLLRVLPGIAEEDFQRFAAGLACIQDANGSYFAPAQGGGMYVSHAVATLLDWLRGRFPVAVGQSSWGPTGFAFVPSQSVADEIIGAARAAGTIGAHLRLLTVCGRNRGAVVSKRSHGRFVPVEDSEAHRS
jgi:beta-RFAP synthase